VESLAFRLGVSVVASFDLSLATESCLWDLSEDGIVGSWLTGDGLQEPVESLMVVTATAGSGL